MRFSFWPALFVIGLIPLLWRRWRARGRPSSVAHPAGLAKVERFSDPQRYLLIIRCMALVCLIVALARPQSSFRQTHRTVSGVDIVLLMDVSPSMESIDIGEQSRLEIAKQTMRTFIEGRKDDRMGFIIFSGEPLTLAPPTLDYGLLLNALDNVKIGVLKDGTAIGDGLALAVNRLKDSKAKSRIVVLLTDGDNNVGQVDPMTAGELAAGYGIKVYTIAIGKEGRVKIPIRTQNAFGQETVRYVYQDNALNPQLLKEIASVTNGRFYRVTEEGTLKSVFKEIDHLEKSEWISHENVRYEDQFHHPLIWGLLFLALEQVLGIFVWRILP